MVIFLLFMSYVKDIQLKDVVSNSFAMSSEMHSNLIKIAEKLTQHNDKEFHDLEIDTMMKALQALEAIGKCRIVQGDGDEALVSSGLSFMLIKFLRRQGLYF